MINQTIYFFTLRPNKAGSDAAPFLVLVATINGKRLRKSLGFSIPVKYWNQKAQTARPGYKDSNRINQKINLINSAMLELTDRANRAHQTITPDDLQRIFKNSEGFENLVQYIERKAQEDFDGMKIKKSTKNTYLSFARELKKFRAIIPMYQVNPQLWEDFKVHSIAAGNKKNTLCTKLLYLKAFVSRAEKDGLIQGEPLRHVTEKKQKTRREHLSLEEIDKTEKFYFQKADSYDRNILRAFLFSCFTGLRISDVRAMEKKDISGAWARITTIKNQTPDNIPLNHRALKILQSGQGKGEKLFKNLHGRINADLKRIFAELKIDKKISFHVARHSFATNSLLFSGDIETVSKLLGHADIKTTQIYAHTLDASKMKVSQMWDKPAEIKKADFKELLKPALN